MMIGGFREYPNPASWNGYPLDFSHGGLIDSLFIDFSDITAPKKTTLAADPSKQWPKSLESYSSPTMGYGRAIAFAPGTNKIVYALGCLSSYGGDYFFHSMDANTYVWTGYVSPDKLGGATPNAYYNDSTTGPLGHPHGTMGGSLTFPAHAMIDSTRMLVFGGT